MGRKTSRLPGFRELPVLSRRRKLEEAIGLDTGALDALDDALLLETADLMVENVIGLFSLPFGIATNFLVDGKDVVLPMVVEEASVIGAASNGAKMARQSGGFQTELLGHLTIGQVEIQDVFDIDEATRTIHDAKERICRQCDHSAPNLLKRGGGCRDIEVKALTDNQTLVVHLLVDCRDAMGANIVNRMAEQIAPELANLSGGQVGLRIVSNLADQRLVRAQCRIEPSHLARSGAQGKTVRDNVARASHLATIDPYRAATHNKGIMNGVDALMVATGNDWRSIEAGAHAFAAQGAQYAPLSRWSVDLDGMLLGDLLMPMAVGIAGGATQTHPTAVLARKIMQVNTASELARLAAALGLAQNLAALAALTTEGIQSGQMPLHQRSLKRNKTKKDT